MKRVLILGAEGNMGRRYRSIAGYLGHAAVCLDLDYSRNMLRAALAGSDAVIVATPTKTHAEVLTSICAEKNGKRIDVLCEKPITKSLKETIEVYEMCKRDGVDLYSVNQYAHLPEHAKFSLRTGQSFYNFYNTGKDGIHWDCFQIYALASHIPMLSDTSPVWQCHINDISINPAHMDFAYVLMVSDFLGSKNRVWGEDIVLRTTEIIEKCVKF